MMQAWLLCLLLMTKLSGAKQNGSFVYYWNVDTGPCASFGIHFDLGKYGIVQNTGGESSCDKITIFYGPGMFPTTCGKRVRNGGIPQRGNFSLHTEVFRHEMLKLPSNFSGVAVLDFENYLPSYNLAHKVYRDASREWAKEQHPDWPSYSIEKFARETFNSSAKIFFEALLQIGLELHPNALWGYYHYPYCYNGPSSVCRPQYTKGNDKMLWLFNSSSALFPSIYVFNGNKWNNEKRKRQTKGRLTETVRMRRETGRDLPILPYFHYAYHSTSTLLHPIDMVYTMGQVRAFKLEGGVIWGGHIRTEIMCNRLKEYVETCLGPLFLHIKQAPLQEVRLALHSDSNAERFVEVALNGTKCNLGGEMFEEELDELGEMDRSCFMPDGYDQEY